jgi:cephalosporin-C deacetylase-like acetyl esterase
MIVNMRKGLAFVLVSLALVSAVSAAPVLEVTTDRPDAIYKSGEAVRFLVTLKDDGQAVAGREVDYKVIGDGEVTLSSGTVTMTADKPAQVVVATSKPEFFRCEVSFKTDATTRPTTASIGAAVEPDKLAPSLPVPDDFDAFWAAQKKQLADALPVEPVLTPVESKDAAIEAFDLQIADSLPGTNLSAYYARPKGAKPKSLPAILYSQSAGARDSDLPHAVKGAKLAGGAIALDFNAHGIRNAQPAKYYTDMLSGPLADHRVRGMQDRDKVYFRTMYLRGQRALAFLTSQPEWDGHVLIVEGSSQGGAQSLVAAGLDHRITLCLASVPALSDLTAATVGRESGWPKMLKKSADGSIDEKAIQALRYVDVANFASRIQCRTIVSAGFIDRVCPPSSVYAAFNNIPASVNKTIVSRPAMGHSFPPDMIKEWDDVIRAHVAEMRRQQP